MLRPRRQTAATATTTTTTTTIPATKLRPFFLPHRVTPPPLHPFAPYLPPDAPAARPLGQQLSSFIDNLSHGTRFAQHLENLGIDVARVSRSLEGLTAGEMMEGVKDTGGKVRGEARRLRTEAARVQKVNRSKFGVGGVVAEFLRFVVGGLGGENGQDGGGDVGFGCYGAHRQLSCVL